MKKNAVKVYLEWFNYEGKVQSRDLIAVFESVNWARKFVDNSIDDIDDRFSRFVIVENERS